MLLQLLQETFTDPSITSMVGIGSGLGATVGSVVTMTVQKVLNKKKDSAEVSVINYEVIDKQFKSLWDNLEQQGKVIKELQDKSCYREPCNMRVNGNQIEIPGKPKNKKKVP